MEGVLGKINYRPDIDGLRSLAVVPVILFHAGASWLPGGFVGVDIFFVISGFLITSIISREVSAGQFTYRDFYERRIRRIFPALFVVTLATVLVFQLIALPDQAEGAAKSGLAALLSLSNFYFWGQSGYFSPSAEFMPLLHTWSLAVEEQFYIVLPIFLVIIHRLHLSLKWIMTVGMVACFAAGLWLSLNKPSFAYYLLPARAWELGLGSVLAIGCFPNLRSRALREAFAGGGYCSSLHRFFWLEATCLFPVGLLLLHVLAPR